MLLALNIYVCMYIQAARADLVASSKRGSRMADKSTRLFSMNMPVSTHAALKREAFERGVTMGEIVVEALKQWGLKDDQTEVQK